MKELEYYRMQYQKWIKENEEKGVRLAKENEELVFNKGVLVLEQK